jgi:hypothetical protein
MKHVSPALTVLAALFLMAPLSSAFARAAANAPPDDAMPRIARNQIRPIRAIHTLDCVDPNGPGCIENQDPDGGGSYTAGGCNCSRICYEGHSDCNLSVTSNGCTAGTYPALCKSCSVSGACGW